MSPQNPGIIRVSAIIIHVAFVKLTIQALDIFSKYTIDSSVSKQILRNYSINFYYYQRRKYWHSSDGFAWRLTWWGKALLLVGAVPVYCDWVRHEACVATCVSCVSHINCVSNTTLISLYATQLAWGKTTTNKQTKPQKTQYGGMLGADGMLTHGTVDCQFVRLENVQRILEWNLRPPMFWKKYLNRLHYGGCRFVCSVCW